MKLILIDEQGLKFDDGTVVEHFHDQDCCETVYADWKQLEDTGILNREFNDIKIEGVKRSGFRLNGYFVPCYNEQNGYYSSGLEVWITKGNEKRVVDVSEFVEDKID